MAARKVQVQAQHGPGFTTQPLTAFLPMVATPPAPTARPSCVNLPILCLWPSPQVPGPEPSTCLPALPSSEGQLSTPKCKA